MPVSQIRNDEPETNISMQSKIVLETLKRGRIGLPFYAVGVKEE